MRTYVLPFVVLALLGTAVETSAEFYRWTDRDGTEFFTNERDKVPPEYRATAERVNVSEAPVNVEERMDAPGASTVTSVRKTKTKSGDEAYWRERAETLRRQIRQQQKERDRLVAQEREAEETHMGTTASVRKARAAREKKLAKVDRKIADLQYSLDVDLAEEARKADVPPGWIR